METQLSGWETVGIVCGLLGLAGNIMIPAAQTRWGMSNRTAELYLCFGFVLMIIPAWILWSTYRLIAIAYVFVLILVILYVGSRVTPWRKWSDVILDIRFRGFYRASRVVPVGLTLVATGIVSDPPPAPKPTKPELPKPTVVPLLSVISRWEEMRRCGAFVVLEVYIYRMSRHEHEQTEFEYQGFYMIRPRPGGLVVKLLNETFPESRIERNGQQPMGKRWKLQVAIGDGLTFVDESCVGLTIRNHDGPGDFEVHALVIRASAIDGWIQMNRAIWKSYDLAWTRGGKKRMNILQGDTESIVLATGEHKTQNSGGTCRIDVVGWTNPEREQDRTGNVYRSTV